MKPGPQFERIQLHYDRIGLGQPWEADRVRRLCKALNCTLYELGALCCVPERTMRRWNYGGLFPTHVSLLFALIEAAWDEARGIKRSPIMPDLHVEPHHSND